MLKVYVRDGEPEITEVFEEFPNEVTVALNISNCIGMCEECSEPWLREDSRRQLTDEFTQEILDEHQDCTVFGLMGGDSDHEDVKRIADYRTFIFCKMNSDLMSTSSQRPRLYP